MDTGTLSTLSSNYAALGITRLTIQEENYIQRRAQGLEPLAAARAAQFPNAHKAVARMAEREDINLAISYAREMMRQQAINNGAIEFTKDDATQLYLEAHATSINSMEKIRAIDSLVKLHGLAAPERREIEITQRSQMSELNDDDLLRMTGQDISLDPSQYTEVHNA